MKVVVAGGTGFVGSRIVKHLSGAGHEVTVLTRDPKKVTDFKAVKGDVTNPGLLKGTLDGAAAVVGAAQFPNHPVEVPRKGLTYDRYDRMGTEHLVEEAKRAGVKRFFYVSGAGASPSSHVSWYRAKGLAEQAVRESGLEWVALRPSWAYGPGDRALNRLLSIARRSPIVPRLGLKTQRIMPVYVEDIGTAAATIFADDDAWNRVYEIGGPHVLTMQEVMSSMLKVAGLRRIILPLPAFLAKLGTAPLALLPRPFMTPQGIEFAIQDGLVDNSAIEEIGITTRPLPLGLAEYLTA